MTATTQSIANDCFVVCLFVFIYLCIYLFFYLFVFLNLIVLFILLTCILDIEQICKEKFLFWYYSCVFSLHQFVALYDYDLFKSSPNPNLATELGLKEGDILRVFDTSRKDGFYVGKVVLL